MERGGIHRNNFDTDIYGRPANPAWLYRMAFEKAEERPGRKRQGNNATAPGAADRIP